MNCRTTRVWLLLIPVLFCGISCSSQSSLNPAHGKVTLKGQPLEGARVILHPTVEGQTEWPAAITSSDGSFTLKTGARDGAAVGTYQVSIVKMEQPAAATEKSGKKPIAMSMGEEVDKLKGAYANPTTSKLTAEIKEGENQLGPFELK